MKKISILLLLLLGSAASQAQQEVPADGTWSLQEAVEWAWRNNIQVKQSQLQVQSSEINYMQSKLGRLPTLNGQASHGYSFGRSIDPFTNQFTTDPIRSNSFGLSSQLDILNGFQAHNRIKAQYADLQAAQSSEENAKNIVGLQVTNAYLQVLLNRELAEISQVQLRTSQEQRERTRILVEAGSLPQANLYDLESQLATDEVAAINAENNLEIARLNLQQALQLPGDQPIEIEPIDIDMSGLALTTNSPQQIYAIALENQHDIKAARYRQQSSNYSVKIARGALYPRLFVNANAFTQYSSIGTTRDIVVLPPRPEDAQPGGFVEGTNQVVLLLRPNTQVTVSEIPFWDQLDFNRRENLSLNLNIPIFNNFQGRSQVGIARVQAKTADLEIERVKNQLRTSIEQAYADARASAKRYAALQKQVEALELAFKNAETRRDVGAISSYDYIFAKNNLDRARAELSQAKYTYAFRLKVLDFYMGNSLSFE